MGSIAVPRRGRRLPLGGGGPKGRMRGTREGTDSLGQNGAKPYAVPLIRLASLNSFPQGEAFCRGRPRVAARA